MALPFSLVLLAALVALAAGQATNGSSSLEANGTAAANSTANNATWTTQPLPLTTNDYCGVQNKNMTCLIDGILPCCSAEGFCGGTKTDCGDGCQSAFGNCAVPSSSSLGHPACSWSEQGNSPRCDGQCGVDKNNARCDKSFGPDALAEFGVFKYGPCCSKYGFCGNTAEHCEIVQGCQSGCHGGDPSSASSAAATVTMTAAARNGAVSAMRTSSSSGNFAMMMMGLVWVVLGV